MVNMMLIHLYRIYLITRNKTRSQMEHRKQTNRQGMGLILTRDPRNRRRIWLALEMQCMELKIQGRIADGGTGGDG